MPKLNRMQKDNWKEACTILDSTYEWGDYARKVAYACGNKDLAHVLDGLLTGVHEAKLEVLEIVNNDDKDDTGSEPEGRGS